MTQPVTTSCLHVLPDVLEVGDVDVSGVCVFSSSEGASSHIWD